MIITKLTEENEKLKSNNITTFYNTLYEKLKFNRVTAFDAYYNASCEETAIICTASISTTLFFLKEARPNNVCDVLLIATFGVLNGFLVNRFCSMSIPKNKRGLIHGVYAAILSYKFSQK